MQMVYLKSVLLFYDDTRLRNHEIVLDDGAIRTIHQQLAILKQHKLLSVIISTERSSKKSCVHWEVFCLHSMVTRILYMNTLQQLACKGPFTNDVNEFSE